jgi:hypothetical protein
MRVISHQLDLAHLARRGVGGGPTLVAPRAEVAGVALRAEGEPRWGDGGRTHSP